MVMVKSLTFDPTLFPGYHHSTTDPKVGPSMPRRAVGIPCSWLECRDYGY